jgi:hypothetical protein
MPLTVRRIMHTAPIIAAVNAPRSGREELTARNTTRIESTAVGRSARTLPREVERVGAEDAAELLLDLLVVPAVSAEYPM